MRCFIEIELPETAKYALAELQQDLKKTGADIRWVKAENFHLTLKFLVNIEERIIDNIVEVIKGTCNKFGSFTLELKGTGVFPNIKSPRVIWVGLNGNTAITDIQEEIDNGLSSLGIEREKRKFTPHLTLGRLRSSKGKHSIIEKIVLLKDRVLGTIDVKSISFIKSELGPGGPKYTRIAEEYFSQSTQSH